MSTRIVSGIYLIRNLLNGKVYVGQSVNLTDRWELHRRHLNNGTHHCRHLQHAWVKYGPVAFVFEIIEAVEPTKEALDSREQVHLDDAFAAGRAYNLAPTAGSALGVKRSEAFLAKMRGRRHTAESLAKMSLVKMGKTFSDMHRANMSLARIGKKRPDVSAALTGRKQTPEHTANSTRARTGKKRPAISAALKGRVFSDAHRAKLSAASKGRPKSVQHREAIRLVRLGTKASAETKASMAFAQTRRQGGRVTPDIVRAIRTSSESGKSLAVQYGVTPMTICDVRTLRTWRHLC